MATVEKRMAKGSGLGGEGWRPPANPWSVYTRIPIPVLLVAAIWTYTWIGWWSLVPVGVVCVWTAINPKVFPPPSSLEHWASKAVLAEPIWANRKKVAVPKRHRTAPAVLTAINALGLPFIVW